MASQSAIRTGDLRDLPAMLRLLDDAVRWLVARGAEGQWGREPFSTSPPMVDYLTRIITNGELRVSQGTTLEITGGYVLGSRPDYAPPIDEPERYIEAMVTDRALSGQGVGTELVRDAVSLARSTGAEKLRADCWAGAEPLIQWYERQGFRRGETVLVGDWPAQMLSLTL